MIPSVLPTYSRAPLTFVKGEGSWLTEADGRRFLDLGAGIAVNTLGHAAPELVAALTEAAVKTLGGSPESVDVLLFDIKPSDWSTGGVLWSEKKTSS